MNGASIALIAASAFAIGACASQEPKPLSNESEAVRDFIVANELPETDHLTTKRKKSMYYLSDDYIVMANRGEAYLIEFRSTCRYLREKTMRPEMIDVRRDANVIRAGYDTVRGCWVEKIYPLEAEQANELFTLGQPPTAEVFESEDEKS